MSQAKSTRNDGLSEAPSARFEETSASAPPYLAELNEAQRQAVEALDGPVLMLAGAGTGKTKALTTRLAHLLVMGKAFPGQILAVTFTNKAAREMKDRVARLLGRPSVEGWWLGTFHALAARMLRDHAEVVGLKRNFTILDTDDQLRLMKQILRAHDIDEKASPARAVLAAVERYKDRGLRPSKVPAAEVGDLAGGRLVELYETYQARLAELNAVDFGDLLLHCLTVFQERPDILQQYQAQFRYILVDEYQDTNVAQYLWLRLLASKHQNICCVGDDDQSIYGWRGAEVGNILRFEQDFAEAKVIRLERNYRSTGHILGAASGLIAFNEGRLGKTLWTDDDEGEKVQVHGLWDGEAEARFIGEEIEAAQRAGQSLAEMAILVRTGAQTREFEERFMTLGLPYRVVGGPRFYERMEIRDALAYLRLIHSTDDDLAFERIVNKPKRGLGDATLRQLQELRRAAGVSLFEAAARISTSDELRPQARRALADFVTDMKRWRELARQAPHPELAEIVLDESGYTQMWKEDKTIEAPGRLENLKELVNGLAEFDTLEGFLEHVSLVMEANESDSGDKVTVMTLHAAKGLEFDTVFLPGWEEGLFPNQRALDESGVKGLEEERRLAYVGLTRAKQKAYVCHAANRRLHGNWAAAIPSRFIEEIPEEHKQEHSDIGAMGGAQPSWAAGWGGGFQEDWGRDRYSPGMARARQRLQDGGRSSRYIDGTATVIESLPSGPGKFSEGDRVFHQKFGYGSVQTVEGEKLSIKFDKTDTKKVMAAFVVPAEQAG